MQNTFLTVTAAKSLKATGSKRKKGTKVCKTKDDHLAGMQGLLNKRVDIGARA